MIKEIGCVFILIFALVVRVFIIFDQHDDSIEKLRLHRPITYETIDNNFETYGVPLLCKTTFLRHYMKQPNCFIMIKLN